MVERLQEPLIGVTFVDLDGTLLSGNSMHIFMKRLPGMLMRRHRFGGAVKALFWTAMRSARLVGHSKMKWHLTKTARRGLAEEDWSALASLMADKRNSRVADLVESSRKKGCLTYIATAAPEEYALPLARLLGYEGAIATEFSDGFADYEEKKGEAKLKGIQHMLESEKLRLESFITDHEDDLPTAKAYPRLTILVNPTRKRSDIFHNVGATRYLA